MNLWSAKSLRPLFLPGGVLLAVTITLLASGIVEPTAATIGSYYFLAFAAGLVLAWRFHSSRILFALVVLMLSHRAMEFFAGGGMSTLGSGRIAFELVAFLLPINFVLLSAGGERGFTLSSVASRLGVLFVESVFVAVLCRPGQLADAGPDFLDAAIIDRKHFHWTFIPQFAFFACAIAAAYLFIRFLIYRKQAESGLLWSLGSAMLGLQVGGVGPLGSAFFATSGLILASSIIENSYSLAYHDELTTLPGRRAFNDALFRLEQPYTIAMADIDHFKRCNDTYGHDTGDHVLRMVAGKLAHVGGGGQAYRLGGEEFAILFSKTPLEDALPHLEWVRNDVETGFFQVRTGQERRRVTANGKDRRKVARRKKLKTKASRELSNAVAIPVTISIGAAEATNPLRAVEQVIQAADKALYAAKEGGRNRVEAASKPRGAVARAGSA